MQFSVVIPSWNGWKLLAENLPPLQEALRGFPDSEVLVSDDGSSDPTAENLARYFPSVRVLRRPHNGGFGVAANEGVKAARGEIVVCLNNDVSPEPGFVEPLLASFRGDQSLFAATPCMWNHRFGGDEARTAASFRRGGVELLFPGRGQEKRAGGPSSPILYASGGAAAYRRDRFLELGGFNPIFHPFYWEDVDLGWRAWRRGWGSRHVPDAMVDHRGSATIRTLVAHREINVIYERNHLLFLWSNLLDRDLWQQHVVWLGPRMAWSAARGTARSASLVRACRRARYALHRRREERGAVQLTDRDILRDCAPGAQRA